MPDSRFFDTLGSVSLGELAALADATLDDPSQADRLIDGVAPLAAAGPTSVAFLNGPRYMAEFLTSKAAACFLTPAMASQAPALCVRLITAEPQAAYAKAANRLYRP